MSFYHISYIFIVTIAFFNSCWLYSTENDTTFFVEDLVIYDTIYIPGDTIRITDTVVIYLEKEPLKWGLDIFVSALKPYGKYSGSGSKNIEIIGRLNSETNLVLGPYFGGNVNISSYKWFFQSGLGFIQLREKLSHDPSNILVETKYYTRLDTIEDYFVVDGFDTILVYETEESPFEELDSTRLKNHT